MNETVLVVGSGPVGLTAAAELSRQGARVRLVEALPTPTSHSRAIVVHPRTQEHLAAMGVLDRLVASAQPITAVELFVGDLEQPRARLGTEHLDSRYPRILDVSQVDTEAALREVVAEHGVTVEHGVRFDGLVQDDDGVTVTLTSEAGTEVGRYGWVVGADGGHSAVRSAVGARLEGVFVGQHAVLADVDAQTSLSPTVLRTFIDPRGGGEAYPLPAGRARFTFNIDAPAPGTLPTVAMIQHLVDEQMGGQWRIGAAHWLTYYEVRHGQVPCYRYGRVLLAGDAAHIHSPTTGQGMNTGIQDAVNVAWKLALVSTGRAGVALLDTYDEERHPVGAAVVANTTRITDAIVSGGTQARLRDLGLRTLGHLPHLSDHLMTGMSETAVTYREGPWRPYAVTGDHAPDVPGLLTVDGSPTQLDRLLRRPGHLLLVTGADGPAVERLGRLLGDLGTVVPVVTKTSEALTDAVVDTTGVIARRYGIGTHGYALVRPDGYLAVTSRSLHEQALVAYADGLGRRPGGP